MCGCHWPGQSMADDPQRNFRSAYYEKVGFRGVEEKKSLEILLKDNPLGMFIFTNTQGIFLSKHGLHAGWNWFRDCIFVARAQAISDGPLFPPTISYLSSVWGWVLLDISLSNVFTLLIDLEKLSTFSQRFPLPSMYRIHVWKVLLGKTHTSFFSLTSGNIT